MFVPVASAMAGGHRDCSVLASVAQWSEIQLLVSRPPVTDGCTDARTDNYNLNNYKHSMGPGIYGSKPTRV